MKRIGIADAVTTYRRKENISQEKFGALLGVSAQAVSKWEREICCPDITLLPRLAHILDISIEDMLEGNLGSSSSK